MIRLIFLLCNYKYWEHLWRSEMWVQKTYIFCFLTFPLGGLRVVKLFLNSSSRVWGTYSQSRGRPSLVPFTPLSSDFFLCCSSLFSLLGLHRLLFPFYPLPLPKHVFGLYTEVDKGDIYILLKSFPGGCSLNLDHEENWLKKYVKSW